MTLSTSPVPSPQEAWRGCLSQGDCHVPTAVHTWWHQPFRRHFLPGINTLGVPGRREPPQAGDRALFNACPLPPGAPQTAGARGRISHSKEGNEHFLRPPVCPTGSFLRSVVIPANLGDVPQSGRAVLPLWMRRLRLRASRFVRVCLGEPPALTGPDGR